MRSIDADALKEALKNRHYNSKSWNQLFSSIMETIDNAPTVEPRIEYGTDGQPYKLFMSGGQLVPDMLQGWKYEARPQGDCISREALKEILTIQKTDFLSKSDNTSIENDKLAYRLVATGVEHALDCINIIPTVEPERQEGEWINHRNDYGHNIADCSLCGKTMQWHDEDEDGIPRYCWYCGAPMKGVKND